MCGKTFTKEIYNKFRYSKKFKENYSKYFDLLNKGLTLRECANKLNITIVTAFFWRHRFLFDFKNQHYIEKITSYVELTKMIITENFKGYRDIPYDKRDEITIKWDPDNKRYTLIRNYTITETTADGTIRKIPMRKEISVYRPDKYKGKKLKVA